MGRLGQSGCGHPMVLPYHRRSGRGDLWRGVEVGHGRGAGGGVQGRVVVAAAVVHVDLKVQLLAPLAESRWEDRHVRFPPVQVAGREDLGGSREGHVYRRDVGKAGKATGSKGCR